MFNETMPLIVLTISPNLEKGVQMAQEVLTCAGAFYQLEQKMFNIIILKCVFKIA